jgi:hypothetical protein
VDRSAPPGPGRVQVGAGKPDCVGRDPIAAAIGDYFRRNGKRPIRSLAMVQDWQGRGIMKNLDRMLIAFLALGVWALALKPVGLKAYVEGHRHFCEMTSGTGNGRVLEQRPENIDPKPPLIVEVTEIKGEIYCPGVN